MAQATPIDDFTASRARRGLHRAPVTETSSLAVRSLEGFALFVPRAMISPEKSAYVAI